MRKFEILLVFCLAATFFQLSSIAQAQVLPKRYALLVGIAKYDADQLNQPQLKYPEADAREVGDRLKQGGYEVDLLLGPTAPEKRSLQNSRN